ncbi:MAG TPA: class III poly(R)-hydroxyalkanoic acid synthase subunit PhaC [Ktedonobacterales bacterium]|jgi:polyhydroxyalkanoate synthase
MSSVKAKAPVSTPASNGSVSDLAAFLKRYSTGMRIITEGAQADTAQTPKEVIWSKNKAKLYHYVSATERRFSVPILMVYALINRAYVLDLMPGISLIEYMVNQGFDVYLLDWGTPGDEDHALTFENYVLDYIPQAAKRVMRHAQSQEFTLLGYCMGGTMSLMYAALFPERLRNLILLTAPSDFSPENLGMYGTFTSARYFDPELMVDAFGGNIPGEVIDHGNRLVKPVTNYVGSYVTLWDRVLHEKPMALWLAMSKWVNDGVDFPAATFRQWIKEFYQENRLAKGQIVLRGRRVDLSRITCPVLNIAGTQDHICTIPMAEATTRLISSEDKEFFTMNAGHVGLLTSPDTRRVLWPKLREWLAERSRPAPAGSPVLPATALPPVGKRASLTRTITEADIKTFARVSGDHNPVHLDAAYAATTPFGERIAHGFLVGSLLSALLGTDLPGPGTVYLGQTLKFLAPVHIGDTITVTAEVISAREDKRILTLRCDWINQEGKSVLSGEAVVKC